MPPRTSARTRTLVSCPELRIVTPPGSRGNRSRGKGKPGAAQAASPAWRSTLERTSAVGAAFGTHGHRTPAIGTRSQVRTVARHAAPAEQHGQHHHNRDAQHRRNNQQFQDSDAKHAQHPRPFPAASGVAKDSVALVKDLDAHRSRAGILDRVTATATRRHVRSSRMSRPKRPADCGTVSQRKAVPITRDSAAGLEPSHDGATATVAPRVDGRAAHVQHAIHGNDYTLRLHP